MMQKNSIRKVCLPPAVVALAFAIQFGSTALSQTSSASPQISITPVNKQNVTAGSRDWFTGAVQVQALFAPQGQNRTSGGRGTFEPGGPSAGRTHPPWQILIRTGGEGGGEERGGPG